MKRIKIVTETILEINSLKGDQQAIERASKWGEKVSDFLKLVRKTLVKDINFINQRITSVEIEKDRNL